MRNSIKKMLNVGWLIERCRYCIRERTFAESWIALNKPDYLGETFLQRIFNRDHESFLRRRRPRLRITERDAFVIATVIQWLGTNIGFGWLEETVKKFGYELKATSAASVWRDEYYKPFNQRDNNASAWHNIQKPKQAIPDKLVTRPFKRRHIYRYFPKSCGKKVCIRCGDVRDDYDKTLKPACFPPKLNVNIKKIKDLRNK